mmetsp:Transcript_91635/g.163094  ORF Transcript_91635/g.163094 Transcript_91635/m.163094 type:complete len:311 (-) Transcript_91635:526-1458(-)|eukprot:CAMPEP_0197700420 /NCGR_PEP_ID=MMETSP1338-20131121/121952_1 /TAXON_ID=43686 ORGANISM="Pelagodinium beii, Strain RCC1491" /NCGR_SAMPLE_ID=MMETSP1338 /ASSEMBLY_ACC=CAM_ASM_000754 /LENGTH=310 /DNA_ID=CAMNT_0043284031 /DNA_START=61 /DNA_END=993 /DNA_ORIENTATION=-
MAMHRPSGKARKERGGPSGPLWKTVLCRDFPSGCCKFSTRDCIFAHGEDDLRASPDLTRTSVCPAWLRNGHCEDEGCRYAHAFSELRRENKVLKTQLCKFFMSDTGCIVGSACRFAHGQHELCKSSSDVLRKQRREAFSQGTSGKSSQVVPSPSSWPHGFYPGFSQGSLAPVCVLVGVSPWQLNADLMQFARAQTASQQVHSSRPFPQSHRSAKASSQSSKLRRAQSAKARGRETTKMRKDEDDETSTMASNVDLIRAAMSRRLSDSSTLTAPAATGLESEAKRELVIRNTFIDTRMPEEEEQPRRSKSV